MIMIYMTIAFYDGIPEVVSTRPTNTLAKYDWHTFLSNGKRTVSRDEIFESYERGYWTDENGFELRLFADKMNPFGENTEHLYDRFDENKETETVEIDQKIEWFDSNILDWNVEIVDLATWLSQQKYIIFGYDGSIAGSFVNASKLTHEQITRDKLWDDQHNVEVDKDGIVNGQLENGWFTAVPISKIKEF